MKKNLVIVESPAKARTIEKYLGGDYVVKSSFGHIRDLPRKHLSIDKENDFEPSYEVPDDKKKVVAELKKAVKNSSVVWLASDEDREGEAIAWHLCQALGLDSKNTKRIVFHEITKPAIEAAVKNPRTVDQRLVDAQQARRVLDRLVGYELSPVLWKKVRTGLSAGRVQSVAVRLLVEREREIGKFEASSKFKISAEFKSADGSEFKAELPKALSTDKEAEEFLKEIAKSNYKVSKISKKAGTRNPSAPFTTSSLQQEASSKLGFSVKQTMTLAQRLYENGDITYMRTDSTNLSQTALTSAEKYIKANLGDNYHSLRTYATKSAGAQEAHEAIRPTDFNKKNAGADEKQEKLYQLIWRRALASQMASAQIERTEMEISISDHKLVLVAKGEILKFDGYQKVYGNIKEDTLLPDLEEGAKLDLIQLIALQAFDRPPARYSEASLVKKLEELGIGRPSTYAPTISTIQTRGYVEKRDLEGQTRELLKITLEKGKITHETTSEVTGADRNKLIPTSVALVTTDFLLKHFASIMDYDFTAKAENDFDKIAEGKNTWHKMIKEFYKDFYPLVEKSESVSREETSQARKLGKDPKSGKPIVVRFGKFGPMLQRGEAEDEEKPDFAPLPEGVSMEEVNLEQALSMFALPRTVGTTSDGQPILANIGRFGPYIKVDKIFVSIKPLDPFKITEEEARALYKEKLEKEANKYIKQFDGGVSIINGPFGPYITDGKKNAKVPKGTDPASLDEKTSKELLKNAPVRKKRFKKKS